MNQQAPDPEILFDLVKRCSYRPGWQVWLVDRQRDADHGRGIAGGLTLVIVTSTSNSYHPGEPIRVNHYFIVPAATYNERSWKRWLFEQFALVERHECMEFFALDAERDKPGSGDRPFAPVHAPGFDPYTVFESATDEEKATSFQGIVNQ